MNCSPSLSAQHPLFWLWILVIFLARGRSLGKEKSYKFLMSLPICSPPGYLGTKFALASMPKVPGARRSALCSVGGSELSMAVFDSKVFRTVIATGLDVFYLFFLIPFGDVEKAKQ